MKKIIIIICLSFLFCCDNREWVLIKEGQIKNIEYTSGVFADSKRTFITFTNNSTFILSGNYILPGGYIKIYVKEQGFWLSRKYKIEKINGG